jgi:hypothetical protein
MDWSKGRSERHYALYPPEEKARRNRLAQVNYRKRNANCLKHVGTVTNILKRQSSHYDDIPNLEQIPVRLQHNLRV